MKLLEKNRLSKLRKELYEDSDHPEGVYTFKHTEQLSGTKRMEMLNEIRRESRKKRILNIVIILLAILSTILIAKYFSGI